MTEKTPSSKVNLPDPSRIEWDEKTGLLRSSSPAPARAPEPEEERVPWARHADEVLRVSLPNLGPLASLGENASPRRRDPARSKRILLLETDDETQRVIAKLLIASHHEVWRTYTWSEARRLLEQQPIDLFLTRKTCFDDELNADTLNTLAERMEIRVLDDYADLLIGQRIRYDRMAKGLISTLDTLVSQLEQATGDFTSHAQSVARYAQHVGRRLGLAPHELHALAVAAYFHGLPEILNPGADSDPEASRARLLRSIRSIDLPYDIRPILLHLDDPYPSEGVPITARILAVADAYEHFCASGKIDRTPAEGVVMLRDYAGTRFDPRVVEIFVNVLRSDLVLRKLDRSAQRVLITSYDKNEADLYGLRLRNEGYGVLTSPSLSSTLAQVRQGHVSAIVARHNLRDGNGFDLLTRLADEMKAGHLPVFLITPAVDHETERRALQMGAEDVLASPVNTEVLALKVRRALERARQYAADDETGQGVRGNIEDLGIIEAIQILSSGGRSATIRLANGPRQGRILIDGGNVTHAELEDLEPMDAFVEMVGWNHGTFLIERSVESIEPTIRMSTDGLLLEACRRLDESSMISGEPR